MFTGFFLALQRYFSERRTARALAELDDRQLADIGLNRSEILRFSAGFGRDR